MKYLTNCQFPMEWMEDIKTLAQMTNLFFIKCKKASGVDYIELETRLTEMGASQFHDDQELRAWAYGTDDKNETSDYILQHLKEALPLENQDLIEVMQSQVQGNDNSDGQNKNL